MDIISLLGSDGGRVALLASGWAMTAVGFALLWLVELRRDDASLVDVGWAGSLGLLAIFYALMGPGLAARRWWTAVVVGAWSFRLAAHIWHRHRGEAEDGRYRKLRAEWGERAHGYFFLFYQAQALLAGLLSLPFLLIAFDPAPRLRPLELVGWGLAALALVGETVADRQLARHRKDPSMRGKTCRRGLWRYSRHPNYFFEWLIWCGFALAALSSPTGYVAVVSPLVMLVLILKVTGIPPTEERALRSRGEDYRQYQRTTSAFVPWFPEEEAST